MPDFPPDELGREIDALWAKVSTAPLEVGPGPGLEPMSAKELAWETVDLLKRQHRQEARYWAEVLEAKERALQSLKERQGALEAEAASLRRKARVGETAVLQEILEMKARMEAALSALEQERAARDEEEAALRALLVQSRERLASEAARRRQELEEWDKREQAYLLEARELQGLVERHKEESLRSAQEARGSAEGVREAKSAIEKTLAELLKERQAREEADRDAAQALKRAEELERHLEQLSKLWEEERAQWRELWESREPKGSG